MNFGHDALNSIWTFVCFLFLREGRTLFMEFDSMCRQRTSYMEIVSNNTVFGSTALIDLSVCLHKFIYADGAL